MAGRSLLLSVCLLRPSTAGDGPATGARKVNLNALAMDPASAEAQELIRQAQQLVASAEEPAA
eukprot:COSAG01_NODE_6748_length_3517_cov_3.590111_4_plen_62_part_01